MSDLVPATAGAIAAAGDAAAERLRYTVLLVKLMRAGAALRHMAQLADSTFDYVEDCAASISRLAETAAQLNVDHDTVGEHHQAAQIMRGALAQAKAMAAECQEMSTLFEQASASHQADYGQIAAAIQAMPVPMADRTFYANR